MPVDESYPGIQLTMDRKAGDSLTLTVKRSFAHVCDTGGARRSQLRGLENVNKRYVIQAAARNLGLLLRKLFGVGTPRSLQGLAGLLYALYLALIHFRTPLRRLTAPWRATAAPALRCLRILKNQLAPSNPVYFSTGCQRNKRSYSSPATMVRSETRRVPQPPPAQSTRCSKAACAFRWWLGGRDECPRAGCAVRCWRN